MMNHMERPLILDAAATYSAGFRPNNLTAAPKRHVAVLACMDARLDLFRLLGLEVGDFHLLRNAGGRATDDAIRSFMLSSNALGTREFVVIHHTGCGLFQVTNEQLADRVQQVSGARPSIEFHPFADEAASVTEDVKAIARCQFLPADAVVWGALYDVHTGQLIPVGEPLHCQTGTVVEPALH
jgi:carbonic anhydrase